jgi:hypothetical protein
MNTALQPIPAPACLHCGTTTAELIDGYCDETDACHRLGVAAERERLECEEEMQHGFVCVCGAHKEVQ